MTLVHFCWPYEGEKVYIAGTFTDWEPVLMNKTISKLFRQSFTLEPGIYQYKFIVEDEEENREWFYDICRPNCDDGSGNWNNLIQVEPRIEKNNFYITTAINYTNGSPHFGHAYEAISGDTIARYHRVAGKNVFFVTGTDEHGQKVAEAARAIGMEPLELCDKYVAEFRGLNAKLNVSEDFYIRTTMKKHEEQCLWLWKKATEAGDIYLGKYEGWYNVREEKFVTETEAEKSDFKDPGSGKPLRKTSEASYFFRMSKYQQRLLEHIYDHPEFIFPEEREAEILSRLREPLLDLSISRTTFDWGITAPVPKNGKEKHVMYVWFDALTNYISAVDYPKGKLAKYWPADIHLIGKDIAWFHSVIWPCMLMSTGIPLPRSIVCHGFVNGPDGRKMSKSFGNVIDLFELLGSYSSDNLRYFVMREGVFGNDFSLSIPALILRHDAELADDLGNLVHRSLKLSSLWCDSKVPEAPFTELFSLEELKETVEKHMVELRIQQALEAVLLGVKSTNKFLADISPWNLPEEEIKTKLMCVRTALEAVYILSHFYAFVIPDSAQKIFDHLGSPMTTLNKLKGWGNLTPGTSIIFSKQDVLFRKIQDNRFEKKQKREAHKEADRIGGSGGGGDGGNSKANEGGQDGGAKGGGAKGGGAKGGGAKGGGAKGGGNKGGKGGAKAANNKPMDIARLNLRVGKIISCKNHPKAAHLYVEEIDIGESKYRQVVSGLANHIPLEEMVDKLVVVVANLKPSKFKEVESQAMLIAATGEDGTVSLVHPPSSATPGEVITVEGYHGDPDVVIDSRKVDVISALKPDMKTDALGVACYCGVQWMTTSGPCTTNQQNAFLG